MRARFYYLLIMLLLTIGSLHAQVPVIQKIEPKAAFPKSRIVISGSGFSSTPSQLQVWFGHVRGTILTSSDFSIEAEVPAQALLDNIRVVNLSTRSAAESGSKFMPVYSGEGFDPSKLTTPLSIPSADAIFDVISTDIDGDNKPDLIGSRNETTATTMALMMNQSTVGNISFTNTVIPSLAVNAPTQYLVSKDLNADGLPDLVASRTGTTANSVFVLRNTSTVGNPSFASQPMLLLDLAHFAQHVEIEDLNGDGKPEVIVANSNSNELYIFRNESAGGTLSINLTPIKIPVTGASETFSLEIQDLDEDGKPDIIATRAKKPDIYLLKNISTSSSFNFTISKITSTGDYNDVTSADFNKDGKLDIVATNFTGSQAHIFLNQSTSTSLAFSAFPITLPTDSRPFGVDVSDLDGDGFPDFIVACQNSPTLNAFIHNRNTASPGFSKVAIATAKTNWHARAGDLDGDAKPDIAFTSFSSTAFSVDILRNKNCHKPQILNTPPPTLCASQTITLNAIPIPGVTFNWSNGFSSIKNGPDPFALINVAATYTVTAVGEGTSCSVVSAPLIVSSGAGSAVADPVITVITPTCVGTPINLSASPTISGATYLWTGPNNFTSNVQTPPSIPGTIANAGIYSLTIKVGDCSSNTITKRVDVVSFGSFSISSSVPSNTVCQGQPLTLNVNSESGYTFQWFKNGLDTGVATPNLIITQEGSYKVKVTNTALGCSQETSAVTVVIFVTPVAAFTADATGCVGNTITFTNNSITDSRVTTPIYAWDFGDNSTSSIKDATHIYSAAQSYNPKLIVSYSGVTGCSASVSKTINIVTGLSPVIAAEINELCPGGSETLTLSATGTGIFTSYLWSTNEKTAKIDVSEPKDYSVETLDANGCKGNATITIAEKVDCTPIETVIPPLFTPNGDLQNDFWVIPGIENKSECTMNIFDGRGRRVLQKKGYPVSGWDGVSDEGKEVPQGTYFYVLSCPSEAPTTGSVLIVR